MTRGSSGAATAVDAIETVTGDEPTTPSAVALICAVPDDKPVTTPDDETDATDAVALLQTKVFPLSALPEASLATAKACANPPTWRFVVNVTVTEATAADTELTVTDMLPVTPDAEA